jgi:hypothetical protein
MPPGVNQTLNPEQSNRSQLGRAGVDASAERQYGGKPDEDASTQPQNGEKADEEAMVNPRHWLASLQVSHVQALTLACE